jgi:AraC family transcriptional regulator
MSAVNGTIPCLGELAAAGLALPAQSTRPPPACDFAEARVWEALGGGWQCLYGCYCQCGVSIEWHDFACAKPRDWSRSFHPDGLELCLNLSGRARMARGRETVLLGPMTTALYFATAGELAAWRLPGEPHQFLTVEFSRAFLEQHLKGHELALDPVARQALQKSRGACPVASVGKLTVSLRKRIERLRQPPVAGPGQALWHQSQALELAAEFFFAPANAGAEARTRRTEVAGERVEKSIRILSQQLAEPPSLEELGRAVGCSPYHLSRTFSREMGMTIPQYLRQIRMERAAELLKSGKFNVTEAALEVGYSSLSHFSQAFCETMGCCPGLYPLGLVCSRPQPAARPLPAAAIRRQ